MSCGIVTGNLGAIHSPGPPTFRQLVTVSTWDHNCGFVRISLHPVVGRDLLDSFRLYGSHIARCLDITGRNGVHLTSKILANGSIGDSCMSSKETLKFIHGAKVRQLGEGISENWREDSVEIE